MKRRSPFLVVATLLWMLLFTACTSIAPLADQAQSAAGQPTLPATEAPVDEGEPTAIAAAAEDAVAVDAVAVDAAPEAPIADDAPPAAINPPPFPIRLPPGFRIDIYATNVPNARAMALSPNGTLFVGTRSDGRIYAVRDNDGDYQADEVFTIVRNMFMPNGVAFRDGALYVAEVNRILRYDDIEANLESPPDPVIINDSFPSDTWHGWKFIRFGPDDKLYVPVGAPCNVCDTEGQIYGNIMRMNPDGSELEMFAQGMRNTVGFDWHPVTGDFWWTDNGRDNMGDDLPPDELNRATALGQHFGFPFCHAGTIPEPGFASRTCDEFIPPAQQLGPHVAALGVSFYTGDMFPAEYRNQLFIAEHGSWNRSDPIGYRVMLVRLDEDSQVTSYEVFAEGWLEESGKVWGRPVATLVLPDGSMLLSDDTAGVIYRISYGS